MPSWVKEGSPERESNERGPVLGDKLQCISGWGQPHICRRSVATNLVIREKVGAIIKAHVASKITSNLRRRLPRMRKEREDSAHIRREIRERNVGKEEDGPKGTDVLEGVKGAKKGKNNGDEHRNISVHKPESCTSNRNMPARRVLGREEVEGLEYRVGTSKTDQVKDKARELEGKERDNEDRERVEPLDLHAKGE